MKRLLLLILVYIPMLMPVFADDTDLTSLKEDRTRTLRYGIDDEVIEVITEIRKEKDNSYNDVLLEILSSSSNSKIQLPILEFFEQQKTDIASDFVLSLLKNATEDYEVDSKVLSAAISYCGTLKIVSSAEYLYKLSDFKDKSVAASAIKNLGKTGNKDYADQFLNKIKDNEYEDDETELRESAILLMGDLKYEPAVDTLLDIVKDDSYSKVARRYACDSLGKIGDEKAIPVLKGLLNDPDSILRSYALSSLANFKEDEIETILIQALRDSYWRIRVAAAKALAERKANGAIDILIYKAEKDPEPNVKNAAMDALAVIGGNKAWSFLSDFYSSDHNSDLFRSYALSSLLKEKPEKAVDAMKKVFDSEFDKENSWIFNYTCNSLSTTESTSLEWFYNKMLDHKNYIIRIYAIRGIKLNKVLTLYGRVKEIADNDNENKVLRKVAASLQ